ncbi:MAG: FAD:protein FMN transferase [Anaerolineae bacterium]
MMGMPITVEVVDAGAGPDVIEMAFAYFQYVDEKFSTYKDTSEISRINRRELPLDAYSQDMQTIFVLAEQTRQETDGYFDIVQDGRYDPSGIVKGWAIFNAAQLLRQNGCENFYVDAGGDIQVAGKNGQGQAWRVGIRSPFNPTEIVKVLRVSDCGVATSGTYIRGQHIYNPKQRGQLIADIVSLTVVGPDIYEADRFATGAFAMGRKGIEFIARLEGFEGYMIDAQGQATYTSGFERYVSHD